MERKVMLLALLLGTLFAAQLWVPSDFEVQGSGRLERFSSYDELKSFLKESVGAPYYGTDGWTETFGIRPSTMGSTAKTTLTPSFSTTNIQVEGVDEADIVKTDGEFIYVGSGGNVTIMKAYPPEAAEVLSRVRLNGTLMGIFVNRDRLIILEQNYDFDGKASMWAAIRVYDVSERANPVLKRSVSTDGFYFNSRMIGDYAYIVATRPAYIHKNQVALPRINLNGEIRSIQASTIYYSNVTDHSYVFITVLSVNTQNDAEEPEHETFLLGAASSLYVSPSNLYITFPKAVAWSLDLWGFAPLNRAMRTSIHKVHVDKGEIKYVASGEVPGYVLNQFSMDEHEGYFRIATTTGNLGGTWGGAASRSHVYVLDADLNIVGKLENLAPGEKIYSARFMGDRCYLVTFRKVDPLFVIDLENPMEPRVLGQLKITGYSDYLHPYDENHLIGIGKETVAAERGDFAWYQGVKISLFDVSDVANPKEIAKYEIGDRGTESPVLRDHKALLFSREKHLLVLPILLAEIDEDRYPYGVPPYAYGDPVWQGAYVFDISLEKGLIFRGGITHFEGGAHLKGGYRFSSYTVKRALYIDNVLYTISDKKVKMNGLEGLAEINEIEI